MYQDRPAIRLSVEVATGYPLAGCSPAEPTSVSPAVVIVAQVVGKIKGWFSHDARGCSLRVEPRFPALMRLFKFALALVEDRVGAAFEFVDRRDVSDRAVETFVVVMIDV